MATNGPTEITLTTQDQSYLQVFIYRHLQKGYFTIYFTDNPQQIICAVMYFPHASLDYRLTLRRLSSDLPI